jgi:hypothetical protein
MVESEGLYDPEKQDKDDSPTNTSSLSCRSTRKPERLEFPQ